MNTPLWTSHQACHATGGRVDGPAWQAFGITTDSRRVAVGDLFVALPGNRADGHDFVAAALEAGASAALVTARPDRLPAAAALLVVDDTLAALSSLAAAARARSPARVVAVTGSVGKTGSKDALAGALAAFGPAHASLGNLNNHIGVPLSLARLPAGAMHAVFEVGMNHPGEIAPLSRLIRPHVAVVTTVDRTHIGFFDGEHAIALAKAEIFDGLAVDGAAVLNRDNAWFDLLAERARAAGIRRIISFGRASEARVRLLDIESGPGGTAIRVAVDGQQVDARLDAVGAHWGFNAVGVLACIHALNLDLQRAAAALGPVMAGRGRGGQVTIDIASGGSVCLIDESYNASPAAMNASFAVLRMARPHAAGRRIAVLGDMLELGRYSHELHAGLARPLLEAGPDLVFTAGPLMRSLRERLPGPICACHGEGADDIAAAVAAALRDGDVVLVKGSLGTGMAPIVRAIEALAGGSPPDGRQEPGGRDAV